MIVFKKSAELTRHLHQLKQVPRTVGFVPTMGALHAGHITLIEKSKSSCDVTVSSIFVNPTQFDDPKDFEKYPVTIANDILLLENAGCDILFLPSVKEIYPEGTTTTLRYDVGDLEWVLEGKFRPGHFQGVCQVVHRLLKIVEPHNLFMGRKDYQQCLVVKRLIALLRLPVNIVIADTHRDPNGLAMSSRNLRLSEGEKQQAATISKMLRYIKHNYLSQPSGELEKFITDELLQSGFNKVDYVSIADGETLQPVVNPAGSRKIVALIAASIGDVRLIDNAVLQE